MTKQEKKTATFIASAWGVFVLLNIGMLPYHFAPRVQTERIVLAPLPLVVRAAGNLDAKASATLRAQFEAAVLEKQFREGQEVKAGQLLAVLSRDKIKLDYQSKKDALANAEADLTHAQREVRLQKTLFKKQAVAYSSVEEAQRAVVKAIQSLRSAKESFKQAEDQWNSARVAAPFSGTVVKDALGDDRQVGAGKDIVTIADVSEFTVRARVDELDIKQIHEGQIADVRVQIYPQTAFRAKVIQLGSAPEGTGLLEIPVLLRLESTQGLLLRPKLSADVRIQTGQTEPVLSVSKYAISNADGTPRVWSVNLLSRIHSKVVVLGRENPDRVEIKEGVSASQKVCLVAEPDFEDGMRVVVVSAAQAAKGGSRTHALLSKAMNEDGKKKSAQTDARGMPFLRDRR